MKKYLFGALLPFLAVTVMAANNNNNNSLIPNRNGSGNNQTAGGSCPNYFTQVANPFTPCFDSRFPLMVAGTQVIKGGGRAAPPGRTRKKICKCGKFYGITRGYWHPTRVVDVVTKNNCSPSMGQLPGTKKALEKMSKVTKSIVHGGGVEDNTGHNKPQGGFYHIHSWRYPVSFGGLGTWVKGGFYEGSMISPYWSSNNKSGAFWLHPEMAALLGSQGGGAARLFSLPAVAASCIAETTGQGQMATDNAYWLGGCMENALPTTGHTSGSTSTVQAHATIIMRYMNMSNRTNGFASKKNVGNSAYCGAHDVPFPAKSEFKVAMLAPYNEKGSGAVSNDAARSIASGSGGIGVSMGSVISFFNILSKCDHHMGSSEYRWGLGKSDQALKTGDENASYLIWRWVDACIT